MRAHNEVAGADGLPEQAHGDHVAHAAEVLRHLADPTRLHLLLLLARGPQDVNGLTAAVEASRSSVSQHLGRLRLAGLVRARRDGRHMYYSLTSDHIERLVAETYRFVDHVVRDIPHHPTSRGIPPTPPPVISAAMRSPAPAADVSSDRHA